MSSQNVLQLTQQVGSAALSSVFYAAVTSNTDTGLPLSVLVNNLGLTGVPTAPTAVTSTNTNQIASTAFVQAVAGQYAPLAGATFTGNVKINASGAQFTANETSGSGKSRYFFQNNGTTAWALSNASSTGIFTLDRYSSGVFSDSPITVAANGSVSFPDGVNSTSIGLVTPGAGSFTTLAASGASTFAGVSLTTLSASGTSTLQAVTATTISATGAITPSQTNGIVGTTTNNNANAGSVGEFITATGTAVALTTATPANVCSISLTAGDWDLWGSFAFSASGSAVSTVQSCGYSTTSATFGGAGTFSGIAWSTATNGGWAAPIPSSRQVLASTTTFFLVAQANYTPGAVTITGNLQARRRR